MIEARRIHRLLDLKIGLLGHKFAELDKAVVARVKRSAIFVMNGPTVDAQPLLREVSVMAYVSNP